MAVKVIAVFTDDEEGHRVADKLREGGGLAVPPASLETVVVVPAARFNRDDFVFEYPLAAGPARVGFTPIRFADPATYATEGAQ